MVPSVPLVLNGIARTLLMELLPQTTHAYGAQTLQLDAALAMLCAQEFDRAAARLAEENAALAELLAAAAALITEAELRDALRAVTAADASGLLVSALQERNRKWRALLVRVHAQVEQLDGDAARALEARIWAELVESTRRRHLDLAMPS
jgi:CMP-N-acetylneuraminic acid synthetase